MATIFYIKTFFLSKRLKMNIYLCYNQEALIETHKLNNVERYSRGRRGAPAKGVVLEIAARVRIPLSPPSDNNPNPCVRVVLFFAENRLIQYKRKISPFDKIFKIRYWKCFTNLILLSCFKEQKWKNILIVME